MIDSVTISLRLTEDIDRIARIEAARQRISRSELIRRAVVEYLSRQKTQELAYVSRKTIL